MAQKQLFNNCWLLAPLCFAVKSVFSLKQIHSSTFSPAKHQANSATKLSRSPQTLCHIDMTVSTPPECIK